MPEIQLLENWYAEPFSKRKTCEVPGQCGGDCDCGCPYNTMNEPEHLPLISDFTEMFPDEWLAFITAPGEDEETPIHGKLVAHSSHPDEIFDAVNTVLWNQCVYVFFNGDFEAMQASYGLDWQGPVKAETSAPSLESQGVKVPPQSEAVPSNLMDLIYSGLDQLYLRQPNLNEAIRRLRIAKVRLSLNPHSPLLKPLDNALDSLEGQTQSLEEIIWQLEEALSELEAVLA